MAPSLLRSFPSLVVSNPHDLPTAVLEKLERQQPTQQTRWFVPLSIPIPGVQHRRILLPVPNHHRIAIQLRRKPILSCFILFILSYTVFLCTQERGSVYIPFPPSSTNVFRRHDLRRIWEWEIASGHYPSHGEIPEEIQFTSAPVNPALPTKKTPAIRAPISKQYITYTEGIGAQRIYLDIQAKPPNVAYPPRPVPGSVANLDVFMEHCNLATHKYVRDCLEMLRSGAGLDNQERVRRSDIDEWRYIYWEQGDVNWAGNVSGMLPLELVHETLPGERGGYEELPKRKGVEWEHSPHFRTPPKYQPTAALSSPCSEEHPRIFHMFWAGPFTDKPYMALLSYLFTQNVGLHLPEEQQDAEVCRPQFWIWVNPGPAAAVPNPNARREMFQQLASNPWAAPFLHPRFKNVIQFKMWNTTEQLDGVPEVKHEWRALRDTMFNSGGVVAKIKNPQSESGETGGDDPESRVGSKSEDAVDKMSVILSDMARFVLCHRFGGIYLDADTIFLRDWEELWGWKGAFAYRWARHQKYNTAVLKLNKYSALGTFLFRTALKNGLDFHPMTISDYTKDAYLEPLLLRLPDALFDPAWLNTGTEMLQRDRPPQPYFTEFDDFFKTPKRDGAQPAALGFDGFFKGAYSYHFHNKWWLAFDPARNWPDLGPRFAATERIARAAAGILDDKEPTLKEDKRDLDWSTVLKRTFESYMRGERPNMYGEWIRW